MKRAPVLLLGLLLHGACLPADERRAALPPSFIGFRVERAPGMLYPGGLRYNLSLDCGPSGKPRNLKENEHVASAEWQVPWPADCNRPVAEVRLDVMANYIHCEPGHAHEPSLHRGETLKLLLLCGSDLPTP